MNIGLSNWHNWSFGLT